MLQKEKCQGPVGQTVPVQRHTQLSLEGNEHIHEKSCKEIHHIWNNCSIQLLKWAWIVCERAPEKYWHEMQTFKDERREKLGVTK